MKRWDYIRAQIKKEFAANGVTRCEMCNSGMYLSFAHRLKRRFIHTDEEMRQVALLCVTCHAVIERKSHAEMFEIVTTLIRDRQAAVEAA